MCTQTKRGRSIHRGCDQVTTLLADQGIDQVVSISLHGVEYVLKNMGLITNTTVGGCTDDADHPDCPHIVFVNAGLHMKLWQKGTPHYTDVMRKYMHYLFSLPPPISSRIVWRETVLQHFPGPDGDYHHRIASNHTTCVQRVNLSVVNTTYRMHVAHRAILQASREHKRYAYTQMHTHGSCHTLKLTECVYVMQVPTTICYTRRRRSQQWTPIPPLCMDEQRWYRESRLHTSDIHTTLLGCCV